MRWINAARFDSFVAKVLTCRSCFRPSVKSESSPGSGRS